MSHFYGTFPPLESSLNIEPWLSWLAIIGIGLTAYSIAKAIQYLNRMSD
jgi:hypothetical protein